MKARTIHAEETQAGLPLSKTFHDDLLRIMKTDARNPEVQNRYDRALKKNPRRPGPDISFSGNEAKPLFHNTGRGFVEIGSTLGTARTEDGRGCVLVDLDGDGAQDLVIHNYFRNPLVALLNRVPEPGRWLGIRLRGTKSNRFGIGARVTVNGRIQELACGSGYLSGNAPELHFGLGAAELADVTVRWPSGRVDQYARLAPDRFHTLVEGDPSARTETVPKRESIPLPRTEPRKETLDVRAVLKELVTLEGAPAPVVEPAIAIFFSLDCHACIDELKQMAKLDQQARALGLRLVWVSLEADPGKVAREFRVNEAPSMPLRLSRPLEGIGTPTVYRLTSSGAEKYTGRFAVQAAFEEASLPAGR